MLPRVVKENRFDNSAGLATAVCQTRSKLLDRLAEVVADLGRAKLGLISAAETADAFGYDSASFEVERLRRHCARVKLDLESHRSQHGC